MSKLTFSSLQEALDLPEPKGSSVAAYPHTHQPGFYVHVHPRRADGRVRRVYVVRFSHKDPITGKLKDDKEPLGFVADFGNEKAMPYALAQAEALRRGHAAKNKVEGKIARLTFGDVYSIWLNKLDNGEGKALKKSYIVSIKKHYKNFLSALEGRYLDELDEDFWRVFLNSARKGNVKSASGQYYKAESAAYARQLLNAASFFYKIAKDEKGLEGVPRGWDPTREAMGNIEPANKSTERILPQHIRDIWEATNQLMEPWWRDMFRIYLLTGLRDSLVKDMKWSQISFEHGTLTIDALADGTKRQPGKLSNKDRDGKIVLPLSFAALDILQKRWRFAPHGSKFHDYVWYPEPGGTALKQDPRKAWERLTPYCGFNIKKHDLRRTFANIGWTYARSHAAEVSALLLHTGTTIAEETKLPTITIEYMGESFRLLREATDLIAKAVLELAGVIPPTELTKGIFFEHHPQLDAAIARQARIDNSKGNRPGVIQALEY